MATDLNYPPLDYYLPNGTTPTGADYEVGQAIGKVLGVKMDVSNVTFDNIIPGLTSGQYQLAVTFMNDTKAREAAVDFVDAYQDGSSILVKKGNPDGITKLTDLCGKTATTTKTSVQVTLAQSENAACHSLGKPSIGLLTVGTDTECQLQVESGRAVADLADSVTAAYDAKTARGGSEFQVIPGVYAPEPVGITVPKNDPQLLNAIKVGLQEVIANGTYKKILQQFGLTNIGITTVTVNHATA